MKWPWKTVETEELTTAEKRKRTMIIKYGEDWAHRHGLRTAATNKQRYGLNYYKQIGRAGGTKSRGGGFAYSHELAVEAGRKGGSTSRSTKDQFCDRCKTWTTKRHVTKVHAQ